MTAIPLDVGAAQDALARLDEGVGRPGDEELAEALEQYCLSGWLQFQDEQYAAERAAWLATQCPTCGPEGSSGEVCDGCFESGEDE